MTAKADRITIPHKPKVSFDVCTSAEEDARMVMRWRNDPTTLQMSNNSEPKRWPDFHTEFLNSYLSENTLPVFGVVDGQRMAFLRFEERPVPFPVEGSCVWISINVAPDWRGQGFGVTLLQESTNYLATKGVDNVVAEVKTDNARSRKAFIAAGYQLAGSDTKGSGENSYRVDLFHHPLSAKPCHEG